MEKKVAIIIGAGPAGLTAAYELLKRTDIKPIVFEATEHIGGISKTIKYKGNRIDIGGHRFFSKSDIIMKWWQNILPIQGKPSKDDLQLKRSLPLIQSLNAPDPEIDDEVLLIRNRVSRIFFLKKFFDYPMTLNYSLIRNIGIIRLIKIILSYIKAQLFPSKDEKTLEEFFINRFGKEMYKTFFKDYTEKVWGVPCNQIKAEWGAQRIKGLSITKAVIHSIRGMLVKNSSLKLKQKKIETSLIRQFLYPKFGPGQMWETVAKLIEENGGKIHLNHKVIHVESNNNKVKSIVAKDLINGNLIKQEGDFFFSTMPIIDLSNALGNAISKRARSVANGLVYRDFITIGLLLNKLRIKNETKISTINNIVPDNWIYIQEKDVKVGRIQIFNNWSPYMIKDMNRVWIGLEYFCSEGDDLWQLNDEDLAKFAINEVDMIEIIDKKDVLDCVVIRQPKAYPAYFGSYEKFDILIEEFEKWENLFLIGRNGMHRYNNQDHSMLTAIVAVENVLKGAKSKKNVWKVNTEVEYHEEK